MPVGLLCLKIFLARIIDVTLGTIKTFYIVKEKRITASIIAFIETLIWFLIVKEALSNHINSIFIPLSYALGFAVGTYIGIIVSKRIIRGNLTVNVISNKLSKKEIEGLKDYGFGLTIVSLKRNKAHLLIEIDKRKLDRLKECIYSYDNKAFIIVNESKVVHNGFFVN